MGTQIGELFVKIGADTTSFAKGLTASGDGLKGFTTRLKSDIESGNLSIQSLGANMLKAAGPAGVMAGAVGALGISAAIAGKKIYDFSLETAESIDQISDLSGETGIAIETMAGLRLIAGKTGMDINELAGSFRFLGKAVIAALDETSKQADTFKNLGIDIRNMDGSLKDSVTLFKEIATVLSKMPDGFQKSTIEMELFGRAGVKLTEIMNMGGDAIQGNIDKGIRLAGVTKENADEAQKLIDAQAELNQALLGIKETIGNAVIPSMASFIGKLSDALALMKDHSWWDISLAMGVLAKQLPVVEARVTAGHGGVLGPETPHMEDITINPLPHTDAYKAAHPELYPPSTPPKPPGGAAGSDPGAEARRITAEKLAAEQLYLDEHMQMRADLEAADQSTRDQALLDQQAVMDAGAIELQLLQDKNDAILAEQKRFGQIYAAASIAVWQGGTDIMANNLARMIKGQKVSGKEMIKAMGEMLGGIVSQMGTAFIAEGAGYFASSLIPGSPQYGSSGQALALIAEGLAMKTIGALLSSGGAAGGGGGGGGGHGGGKVASAPAAAALPATTEGGGGTAIINIEGGDAAIFTGAQVRDLITQINEQTAKGMEIIVR